MIKNIIIILTMTILIIIWRIITIRISPVSEETVSTAAAPTASASPYKKVVRGRPRPLAPEALPSAHNRSTSPSSRTVRPSKRIFLSLMLFINTRLFRQLLHRLICLGFVQLLIFLYNHISRFKVFRNLFTVGPWFTSIQEG